MTLEEITECDCAWCRSSKIYNKKLMENLKERQSEMNEARQKREEFRANLAKFGYESHTVYSSKVLEAYDLVHCPGLRKKPMKVSFDTSKYPDGLIIEVDGEIIKNSY